MCAWRCVSGFRPAWLLGAACVIASCGSPPEPTGRNVVLVSLDTLRADRLGGWGHPRGTSPVLDRLARGGATFPRCIAQAASTLPSHRSLFQSRVASRTGDDFPMLAEILADEGFATVAFTGGGNVAGELGFDRGFEIYEESDDGLLWAVDRFASWLDARDARPFFAFLHSYDIHVPYDPPPPYDALYDSGYEGIVRGSNTRPLCRAIRGLGQDTFDGDVDLSDADRRHVVALYDGGIRATDRMLGELIERLAERDLLEETILVIVSDHGEEFWDHGSVLHSHSVHQELVHVPLIARGLPMSGPGSLVAETVRNLDVAPTLLEALTLDSDPHHEGESLLAWLSGEEGRELPAISEMRQWKSILRWPWKFSMKGAATRRTLSQLAEDPEETRNRVRDHPGKAINLQNELMESTAESVVRELSPGTRTPELQERLRALGYVD